MRRRPLLVFVFVGLIMGPAVARTDAVHASDTAQPTDPPLAMTRIAPGVYVHQGAQSEQNPHNHGDIANVGFVVGARCVAVIDSGGSPDVGNALLAAIRAKTSRPVCYVINTHMHPDHVFGNRAFLDTQARFVAAARFAPALTARARTYLERAGERLEQVADSAWVVLPDETVSDHRTLDLGARTLRLTVWPAAHTDNDLTVYDAQSRTLWLGDLLFVRRVPAVDASITGWLAALDELRQRDDVAYAIPGHGAPSEHWPEVLNNQYAYLRAVRDGARRMLDNGRSLRYATRHVANDQKPDWLLFDDYHARNVTAAFTELEWQ